MSINWVAIEIQSFTTLERTIPFFLLLPLLTPPGFTTVFSVVNHCFLVLRHTVWRVKCQNQWFVQSETVLTMYVSHLQIFPTVYQYIAEACIIITAVNWCQSKQYKELYKNQTNKKTRDNCFLLFLIILAEIYIPVKKKYSMNQYIKNKIQNLSSNICHVILPGEILQLDKLEGIFRRNNRWIF